MKDKEREDKGREGREGKGGREGRGGKRRGEGKGREESRGKEWNDAYPSDQGVCFFWFCFLFSLVNSQVAT